MEPKPRTVVGVVFSILLVVIALWLIVHILADIWLPLLIITLVVIAVVVAGSILYRRFRRW